MRSCLILLLLLPACGVPPRYSELEARLFVPRCATSGCHDAGGRAGRLDLSAGQGRANLVGVPARNVGAAEEALLLVKPGDPDASFFVRKLKPGLSVSDGVRMPIGGVPLTEDELAAVEQWVRDGAKDD